ncbi:MAG: SUMF1/EgtB/PvdO family nonheme iron enzyme [Planctomycetia bacterium]|nr:SUMF1/EgtB/PvdO family nonheme iron enzyme [Planctomycetia bacterium]
MNSSLLKTCVLLLSLFAFSGIFSTPVFAQEGEDTAAAQEAEKPKTKKRTTKKKSASASAEKKSSASAAQDEETGEKPAARRTTRKSSSAARKTRSSVKKADDSEKSDVDADVDADAESGADSAADQETLDESVESPSEEPAEDSADGVVEETAGETTADADGAATQATTEGAEEGASGETQDSEAAAEESAKAPTARRTTPARSVRPLLKQGETAGQQVSITIQKVPYVFCWCPAGTFKMGAPESEPGYTAQEQLHDVTISKGFWMLQTEVTQAMYESILNENPSYYAPKGFGAAAITGEDKQPMDTSAFPVERVRWGDAVRFCEELSAVTGVDFVLPTEAQWEYACRAGTNTPYYSGTSISYSDANFTDSADIDNAIGRTQQTGKFPPNPWGLYDMMGNVDEWCNDIFNAGYYATSTPQDPQGADRSADEKGAEMTQARVLRGGHWKMNAYYCRSAARNFREEVVNNGHRFDGFRIIFVPQDHTEADAGGQAAE